MKNNSHFRNKSEKLTYIGYGFLLLCVFLAEALNYQGVVKCLLSYW